jgi:hypothetical protein
MFVRAGRQLVNMPVDSSYVLLAGRARSFHHHIRTHRSACIFWWIQYADSRPGPGSWSVCCKADAGFSFAVPLRPGVHSAGSFPWAGLERREMQGMPRYRIPGVLSYHVVMGELV